VLVRLIEVGEPTGQLSKMLAHAAHNQTREVERRATSAATLLEPLLILLMGGGGARHRAGRADADHRDQSAGALAGGLRGKLLDKSAIYRATS
jgi:hypothetical protein